MNEVDSTRGTLERGFDTMKDPNTPKDGRIGTMGIVLIAAIAFIGKTVIDAMKDSQ